MVTEGLKGRDFITLRDFNKAEIETMLDLGLQLKAEYTMRRLHQDILPGRTLFMMFFNPSLRTRNSFEAGIYQLGGHAHFLLRGTQACTPDGFGAARANLPLAGEPNKSPRNGQSSRTESRSIPTRETRKFQAGAAGREHRDLRAGEERASEREQEDQPEERRRAHEPPSPGPPRRRVPSASSRGGTSRASSVTRRLASARSTRTSRSSQTNSSFRSGILPVRSSTSPPIVSESRAARPGEFTL